MPTLPEGPGPAAAMVTPELAGRITGVARLLAEDGEAHRPLSRLASLGVVLVPGAAAAAVTVAAGGGPLTFAASGARIDELHRLQLACGGGKALEALAHNEPRHVESATAGRRWPGPCQAADRAGFGSCPHAAAGRRPRPPGASGLCATASHGFRGRSNDIALLLAAQGGTAAHNAALYGAARQMIGNLHTALESRVPIEQATGILRAQLGVSADDAFGLLRQISQTPAGRCGTSRRRLSGRDGRRPVPPSSAARRAARPRPVTCPTAGPAALAGQEVKRGDGWVAAPADLRAAAGRPVPARP